MMKKKQFAAILLAAGLCVGNAMADTETLTHFTAESPASTTRQVKGVLADDLSIETENAYSTEIVWGDLEFAWGSYGGQNQVWDPENHVLSVSTDDVQQGWYLKNEARLSGPGATVVGNPDHSHILVFNHSCYGIQVAASMRDSNTNDNITPALGISSEYGVGLNANKYEHLSATGTDDYKLMLDAGTPNVPYDNGIESGNLNCAVLQLSLSTPDNSKPTGIDTTVGIAEVTINIQPLGY